jgi:hypothetical protein
MKEIKLTQQKDLFKSGSHLDNNSTTETKINDSSSINTNIP